MTYYAGITIGPIFDTISNAAIPAALWFASYFFSDLARRLCREVKARIPGAEIISPFYEETEENDGVGKYHDRIIFSTSHSGTKYALEEKLKTVIHSAVTETGAAQERSIFPDKAIEPYSREQFQEFLEEYLQIHFVILSREETDGQNCILAISPYLDALELMKTFPKDSRVDPFRRMFARKDVLRDDGNWLIKQSSLFPAGNGGNNFLVNRAGNIRSIAEIARTGKDPELKQEYYYAVVSADGDSMGAFLEGLKNEHISFFSKGCLAYAQEAAKRIYAYGGMPIYAGGDDLLFLAPLSGPDGQSIVSFCHSLRKLFADTIQTEFTKGFRGAHPNEDPPNLNFTTLSFGVAVQFEKFPLYEATSRARELLKMAKDTKQFGEKDNILLELRKHSGQSSALLIHNPDIQAFEELSKAARGDGVDSEKPTALLYTLQHFRAVVSVLIDNTRKRLNREGRTEDCHPDTIKKDFVAAWGNLFDNPGQEVSEAYTKNIADAYFTQLLLEKRRLLVPKHAYREEFRDKSLRALVNVLLWEKFLREKVSEQERADASGDGKARGKEEEKA